MDKLEMILAAVKDVKADNNDRCDKLEKLIEDKFTQLNGRVRKTEDSLLRIKVLWSAGTVLVGAIFHYFFG